MTPTTSAQKRDAHNSGSPKTGEPVYLIIGKLRRTHGLDGDLLMDVLTEHPETITVGLTVFVGQKHKPITVSGVRQADRNLLIKFEGYTDCDQAAIFRNQVLSIKTSEAQPLSEGRFYHHEIIGMNVVDENSQPVGVLTEILTTGANDVYVVNPVEGKEILIPAVKAFILKIDPEANLMVVRMPQWD